MRLAGFPLFDTDAVHPTEPGKEKYRGSKLLFAQPGAEAGPGGHGRCCSEDDRDRKFLGQPGRTAMVYRQQVGQRGQSEDQVFAQGLWTHTRHDDPGQESKQQRARDYEGRAVARVEVMPFA